MAEQRSSEYDRVLKTDRVEAGEVYQTAGHNGLTTHVEHSGRDPRRRGLKMRGRATAERGHPPILDLVWRRYKKDRGAPPAQVYLEALDDVRTATIKPIITAKVKKGASFFTDEY